MKVEVRSDAVSGAGRAAHDVGLAAILGGNLYARVGMHPAVAAISNPRERGEVVNRAWRRYGLVNGLGLAAVVGGWLGARASEAGPGRLSTDERRLATIKDGAVAALAVTGLASAVVGVRFSRMEPNGAVPLADGDEPADSASQAEARTKRALNVLGALNLGSALAVAGVNARLGQANFRRPPVRRLLRRRH